MRRTFRELYMILLLFITLMGLTLQLYLTSYTTIVNSGENIATSLFFYVSYFTVFANIAIVVDLLILLTKPRSRLSIYVNKSHGKWAVIIFIPTLFFIIGLIFQSTDEMRQVIQRGVAIVLHAITPLMFIFCWMFLVPRADLHGRRVGFWLLFTSIYVSLILYRGEILGPYEQFLLEGVDPGFGEILLQMCAFMFLLANFFILWIGIEWIFHRLPFLYKKSGLIKTTDQS